MDTKTEIHPLLVSKKDAALTLGGISVRTVENLLARKELVARKIGRRTLILYSSLRALASRNTPSPSPTARADTGLMAKPASAESE